MRTGLTGAVMLLLLIGGCAVTPDTITHQKPGGVVYQQPQPAANGAIFQANAYRPIFEDHKARMVGDNLTIVITENTAATKSGSDTGERANSANYAVPTFFDKDFPRMGASASGERSYDESAAKSANNLFNGTIAVTVIDVVPNGNLVVSGEKQIAMDNGSEFIRFSGVIDPKDITVGNQVMSTRVADARIEYRTNTHLDAAAVASQITRFFLSVLPF